MLKIAFKSADSKTRQIRSVLEQLRKAGIKFNIKKVYFVNLEWTV